VKEKLNRLNAESPTPRSPVRRMLFSGRFALMRARRNPGLLKDCLATDQLKRWCPGPWGKTVLNRIHW